ncbi:MAG: DMT family transporter [Gammaproteobacteria bacterium]|nr:DMT family transporter [Gammaproteobacteria bacterium]
MKQTAYLYAMIAVLLWSTVATAFKLALNVITPLALLFWSVLISAGCLWLILWLSGRRSQILPTVRRHGSIILLLGLINPTIYYLVLFAAYDRLPAQVAQPINYTWAIVLAWLAVPVLKQSLTRTDILATALGYFGVVVIASQGEWPWEADSDIVGVLLAIASTFIWAGYWLINTKVRGDAIVFMALSFSVALPMLAMAAWLAEPSTFNVSGMPWLSVAWVGLFEMGITFVLWQMALTRAENVSRVGNLIFISPFVSLMFINYFLGESLHATTFVGLLLILTAVISQQRQKEPV